jgi:VWFA-related protein
VGGLKSSDFKIFEDGIEQDLAYFSSDSAASVDDVSTLAKAPARTGPRHSFVICIDALHTSAASIARIRGALENLFEKEKSSDSQYVLISIGRQLQVLQPATMNPLAILMKLRSSAFQSSMGGMDASALAAQLQNIRSRMDAFCQRCACGARSSRGACESEIDTLKQSIDAEAERWTAPTIALADQFKKVVEELAKLPTGRTLILVSDGFDTDPKREFYATVSAYLPNSPQFKGSDSPSMNEVLKTATDRNVMIHAIDSRGSSASLTSSSSMDASAPAGTSGGSILGTTRPATPARTDSLRTGPAPRSPTLEESASMRRLAQATGGIYLHDPSDLLKDFRRAFAEGRQYYLLAYVPKNKTRDGSFRSITVETTDKKLSIRAKPGYWAAQ